MKVKRWLVSCMLVATAIGSAHAAIISDNTIGTLAGVVVHNFNSLTPNTPISVVLADPTLPGATYGERFDGQVVSNSGGFDVLTGTPTNPLNLLANSDADENIGIGDDLTIHGLLGGDPGEGALSVLLDVDTDVFGFNVFGANVVGANDTPGSFTVMFFDASGNSLGSFIRTASNDFFGFRADAGERIRGVSITNTDPAGLGFDNVTFRVAPQGVPEPGTLALIGFGLAGLALARRRRS